VSRSSSPRKTGLGSPETRLAGEHAADHRPALRFGAGCAAVYYYAEKSSRRAQFLLERLSAEQAGGLQSASTPAGPAMPNRFIHLCGSMRDAD